MQYEVDVDIHATVRVTAADEEDALDMAEAVVRSGATWDVNSVYPLSAREV